MLVEGVLVGDTASGPLEDAWVHATPSTTAPSDPPDGGTYGFPRGFGIWYRPIPVDPEGSFELRLPPGRYHVRAGARGYREALVSISVGPEGEPRALPPIRLAWGGLGRIRLRALFDDGTPAASRPVRMLLGYGRIGNESEVMASTDDEGFAVAFVRPSRYRLRLLEPQPGAAPTYLDVRDGELRDVVLRIGVGAYVSGRILDLAGDPVSGAYIASVPVGEAASLSTDGEGLFVMPDGFTASDGSFIAGPLEPGRVFLVARRPGAARGRSPVLTLAPQARVSGVEIRLSERDPGETDVLVRVVQAGEGQPVAGARVRLRRGDRDVAVSADRAVRTNREGYAAISRVPAGDLLVEASLAAPPGSEGEPALAGRVSTSIRHGKFTEITVAMRPAVTIRGRVLGFAGRPAAEARVTIVAPAGAGVARTGPIACDRDGSFALPPLDAGGSFDLLVEAPGHVSRTLRIDLRAIQGPLEIPLTVAAERR